MDPAPISRRDRNAIWRRENSSYLESKRRALRAEKQAYLAFVKSFPCADCGGSWTKEAMTYDHKPTEVKSYDIYRLANHPTASLEKLKTEIKKCDLVCVGCHRDRTNSRLSDYVTSCKLHRPESMRWCKKCLHYRSLARLRKKRLSMIRSVKDVPCLDCNLRFDPWKMDFDHLDGKLDGVSNLLGSQASLQRIMGEIVKCEIICCWCHVLRTVSRRKPIYSDVEEHSREI